MARVILKGLSKVYPGGVRAADSVDLDVAHGEFVVLVGPSGCGKSTTLRMVAGLEEISAGTLRIGERVVNDVPARDRNVAMVFQSYALYPHLSVRQNMAFGLMRRRRHKSRLKRLFSSEYRAATNLESAEIRQRVEAAAGMLSITELLDRRPAALSGGQRQRVAVGRALVRDPEVFLFDEPLSNLDAKLRVEMRGELRDLHRTTGATMLYVTHDQEEAMTLGDRLVVMKDGVVQQCASPAEVYARPANRFVAGFVGTPPMNFLEAQVHGESVQLADTRLPLGNEHRKILVGCQAVLLGIRPGDLRPARADEPALEARVQRLEDLGDRVDLRLVLPSGQLLSARMGHGLSVAEGDTMRLCWSLEHVHWFETGEDGRRLA